MADGMRQQYFEVIHSCLLQARIIDRPELAGALLELHRNDAFRGIETLLGMITTNHDGLLQVASQAAHGGVKLGIPFVSTDFQQADTPDVPVVLQVHGSFTWRFGVPPQAACLRRDTTYSRETLWIPPSILKEAKAYPFNKLMALAYELLRHCDVLRVIGASLTQNDWNVLSLIFNAQRHQQWSGSQVFRIEVVGPQSATSRT
jgi:hypothetical protein